MITSNAAWQLVQKYVAPLPASKRAYLDCLHYILAAPVHADRDIPAANRSAMDGFALRASDATNAPVALRLVGEVAAGSGAAPACPPGACVRILTGANVPPDADAVVRVEDTETDGDTIKILVPARPGQHILRQAENAQAGEALLEAGARLTPGTMALCAAVGCTEPEIYERPTIGIITTGSELKSAESTVAPHEIRDANGPLLLTTLNAHGFSAPDWITVPDDPDQLTAAIADSLEKNTVTLVSGGVSVGKYDHVPDTVKALGGTIQYHGIAMKPGKPQLFATFPRARYLFGLPGNPLAVLMGLHEFALPAIRLLAGYTAHAARPLLRLPLYADIQIKGRRQHYFIARLETGPDGTAVLPVPNTGSSDFVSGCQAQGTIIMPEGVTSLTTGTLVDYRPWSPA
jgi:molybdopterin molybdotransferase